MNKNKGLLYIACIGIIFIIGIPSIILVMKHHQEKLQDVLNARVIESAKRCWNENQCESDEVTLKELYEKMNLETAIDPITKEVIKDSSKVIRKGETYTFQREE